MFDIPPQKYTQKEIVVVLFILAVLIDTQSGHRSFGPIMINHKELLSKVAPFLTFTLEKNKIKSSFF